MIVIRLATGQEATVNQGIWTVVDNVELTRLLNTPAMQPPENGYYEPSQDARMANYVLKVWGGTWESTDEHAPPGLLY